MKATIKDVAQLAGVSFKTVSRVINNEDVVGEKLKQKVWSAIKELNYQPNLAARGLRGAVSSLGFIYDNPNSNYVIAMQNGILNACLGEGYELVIRPCNSTADDLPKQIIEMVTRSRVGGVILTPPISENTEVVNRLLDKKIAVVRIVSGTEIPEKADASPCLYVDDRTAAFDITQHLIELGHSAIAFFAGDASHKSTSERYEGFINAMKHHQLTPNNDLIMPGSFTFDSGVERALPLLQDNTKRPRPTAIFACNDEIAAGVLFAAHRCNLAVPDQLSIAGFEDSPFSRQSWPRLTTAAQSAEDLAQRAAKLLIRKIRVKDAKQTAISERFTPVLVVRESTGPISG